MFSKITDIFTFTQKRKLNYYISGLVLTIFFLIDIIYFYHNGHLLINADSSSEMILANQLNKEKALFLSSNWFYSTEIRILNSPIIYRIALLLFPNNWHLARFLSVSILLLLLILSMILLMKVLGYGEYSLWASCAIIAPFGQWYGWNVIFNTHYVFYIAITFISITLVLKIISFNSHANMYPYILLSILLSFAAGLGGIRQLMICYVPLFLCTFIVMLKRKVTPFCFFSKENIAFISSTLSLFSALLGYFANSAILSKRYHFKKLSDTEWSSFSFEQILACISDFVGLFGWQPDAKIISFSGIVNVLGFLMIIVLISITIYLLKNLDSLDIYEAIIVLFIAVAFVVQLLIYGNTDYYNESYWTPTLPFVFIPLFIFLRNKKLPIPNYLTLCLYKAILLLCTCTTMMSPYVWWVPKDIHIQNVASWLKQNSYTQGFATFWNSNILTELTDGQIETWTIQDYNNLTSYNWLQTLEHASSLPTGKVFLLIEETEYHNNIIPVENLKDHLIYGDDYFVVYSFDDVNQYFNLIE